MNCDRARKFLGAFADDELDTTLNLEVLEHVNFCESCARKIARVQNMKGALHRLLESDRVPAGLADRIRANLKKQSQPSPRRLVPVQRFIVPLGMAAAIAFVWIGSTIWPQRQAQTGAVTPIQAQWVSAIREQHLGCIGLGLNHHNVELGRDPDRIRQILTEQLHLKTLIPDLSTFGYRLHSADKCGIMGIPGAHLVYENVRDGRLISLFTVAPLTTLRTADPFFVSTDGSPCVLAWHETGATYVLAGQLKADELVALAEIIRYQ